MEKQRRKNDVAINLQEINDDEEDIPVLSIVKEENLICIENIIDKCDTIISKCKKKNRKKN
jgi:hypothetical protein